MASEPDDLIARIAAIEPARGTPPLSRRAIRTLTRAASVARHDAPAWTWPKYRLASIGAFVGSSALVVAAIVGLDALGAPAPGVIAAAIRTTSHPLEHAAPQLGAVANTEFSASFSSPAKDAGACPVALVPMSDYAGLRQGAGRATAYRIGSPLSPSRAVLELAPRFGLGTSQLKWFALGAHEKGWWVGSLNGPSLTTYSSRGITWWSYSARKESERRLLHDAGAQGANVPTGAVSSHAAARLLARIVPGAQLGTPLTLRSATAVAVGVPLTVHGIATDERFSVDYFPGGRLAAASGPLTSVVSSVAYPTIAPLSAAQLLRRPKGALVALRGPSSTTPATAPTHSGTPTSTLYCNAVAGVESAKNRASVASPTASPSPVSPG